MQRDDALDPSGKSSACANHEVATSQAAEGIDEFTGTSSVHTGRRLWSGEYYEVADGETYDETNPQRTWD